MMSDKEYKKITERLISGESLRGVCAGDDAKRVAYTRMKARKQKQKENAAQIEAKYAACQPVEPRQPIKVDAAAIADPVKRLGYTLMETTQRLLESAPDAAILRVALEILKLRDADYQSMDKKKFTPQDYYDIIKSLQSTTDEKFETYEEHQEKEKQEEIKRLQDEIKRLEETYHLPEKPKEAPNGNQMPGK